MRHYERAKRLAVDNANSQWEIGFELMCAVDLEDASIREFCIELHGNHDKEDTFGRWAQANRFKQEIEEYQGVDFMESLEITWWAEAWKALQDGMDIEEVLETLEIGQEKKRSISWFRAKRAEATGKTGKLWRRLERLSSRLMSYRKEMDNIKPEIEGLLSHFDNDVSGAAFVCMGFDLRNNEEEVLLAKKLEYLSKILKESEENVEGRKTT